MPALPDKGHKRAGQDQAAGRGYKEGAQAVTDLEGAQLGRCRAAVVAEKRLPRYALNRAVRFYDLA